MRTSFYKVILLTVCLAPFAVLAQLTGVKTIPGDFATVASAVDTLNFYGVGSGGVTFDIAAGHSETLSAKIILTATGTASDPIVFRKAGAGANPVLLSYPGAFGTPSVTADGFFVLAGSDYVTIDGLDLRESASNTNTLLCMEFGYALLKASATDGAQYNTIRNCTISLSRIQASVWAPPGYTGSCGIVVLNSLATASGALTVTAPSGSNSYNRFYSDSVVNAHCGIVIYGYNDIATPYSLADIGNDIGGSSAATGNTIVNFGGNPAPNSAASAGIYLNSQSGFNCRFNTLNNNNGSGANNPNTLRGIYWLGSLASTSGTCSNNSITLVSAAGTQALSGIECSSSSGSTRTVNIDSNTVSLSYPTATSGGCYGIYTNTITSGTLTVNGNSFSLSSAASTGSMYAVYNTASPVSVHEINGNIINAFIGAGNTMSGAMRGFYSTGGAATCSTSISGNRISGVNYTGTTGGSSEFSFIYNSGACGTVTISNNTADNIAAKTTGVVYFIYNSYAAPASGQKIVQGNTILTQLARTSSGASVNAMYGYYDIGNNPSTATLTLSGNTFTGLNNSPSTGVLAGIHVVQSSNAPAVHVYGNTISGLTAAGAATVNGINLNGIGGTAGQPCTVRDNTVSSIACAGTANGISLGSQAGFVDVYRNTVHTLASSGASTVTGINSLGASGVLNLLRNKVYGLSGTNASTVLCGLTLGGGATANIQNNLIGISGLTGFIATGLNNVVGLNITGGTTVNAYFNTISLDASGTGATSGSSGIYCSSSTALTLINNLVVNKSLVSGIGGYAAAFRRSSGVNGVPVSTGLYSATSNNNLFYAGAPDTTRLIYTEGVGTSNTNSQATLSDYRNFMTGRDRASYSYDASTDFASTGGASAGFLHITPGAYTVLSDGGSPVSGVTDDYDGDVRSTLRPDIGADEFTGTSPSPVVSNLALTPGVSCTPVSHTVSADVAAATGSVIAVTLEFAYNGILQSPVSMTNTSGTTWTGVIPVATPGNAVVTWNVTAVTSTGEISGLNGSPYQDDPLNGAAALVTASSAAICPGNAVSLQASALRTGSLSIGTGGSTATNSAANPFYNAASNGHFQYLIRASELSAAGLAPGTITSLAFSLTSLGASSYNVPDFTLKMANTSSSTVSSAVAPSSWTSVYSNSLLQLFGPAPLVVQLPFSTPFVWDGSSNIVIEVCYGNTALTTAMNTSVQSDATSFVSSWRYYTASGASASSVCGTVVTGATASSRPKFTLNANIVVPANSLSWSDGSTSIGTTSPLTVLPSASTTYTATLTGSGGCTVAGTVAVTVYPAVAAPAVTDSIQCGAGVPLCRVTSLSGASSPVYRWYSAPTGGVALQSSTSTTYTTSISSTTTFYVTEFDGNCESSPRMAVVETVSTPPVINVSSAQTICSGDSVLLSASSSNDPNNIYSWNPGSLSGSSVSVSPALTTSYTVTTLDTSTGGPNSGCANSGTVTVTVIPTPGAVSITPSTTQLCSSAGATLTATGGSIATSATLGAGTLRNTATTYPAPFGNSFLGARHQFLIRAAELTAAGLSAGPITSLAFDVVTPVTTALSNFSVSLGHTAITAFNPPGTGFQSGLTSVYSAAAYTPSAAAGFAANTIAFTVPFVWDGTSNLIVETCFNNTAFSSNAVFNQTATTYSSSINYHNNSINICGNTTVSSAVSQRPNIRFGGLQVNSWAWSPGGATTASITVTPSVSTTYTAVSTLNGCSSQGTASVTVPSGSFLSLNCASTGISCFGSADGTAAVSISGGSGAHAVSWSNGAQTDSISGLSAGFYAVTVSDSNGCSSSCSVVVAQAPLLTMAATPAATQLCGTSDSTQVTVVASGGTLPYSGTGVFPQSADTVVYVVADANGCTASDTVVVTSPRYTITATANGNGTVTNPGTVLYYCGDTVTYDFTPLDTCTRVVNVSVNGVPQGSIDSYTFNGLSASQVLSVSFGPVRYSVTATAGPGGSVSGPATPACGTNAVYTITPDNCYGIVDVLVDGVSVGPVSTFTFPAIAAVHSISATFSALSYTVTVVADSGGTATPSGTSTFSCGSTVSITFTPDPLKLVDSVVVDGVNLGPQAGYVFNDLDSNHTVYVYFSGCAVPATASTPSNAQLCVSQVAYQLSGNIGGSASYGLWTSSGSGVFDDIGVGTGTTYTPSLSDIAAGFVTLTITTDDPDGSGDCPAATASTLLDILSVAPVAINGPSDFCSGDTVTLTASGATDYTWYFNTTTVVYSTAASITVTVPGLYFLDGSISGACSNSANLQVTEHPLPVPPVITPLSATEFCDGDNVSLLSSSTFGNRWQDGDTSSVYLALTSGYYRVTYTDGFGCSAASDSIEVVVHPVPVVDILGLDTLYCELGPDVQLSGSPSGGDFSGVGVQSNVFSPGLAGPGYFYITYQYTDTNLCVGEDQQLVHVDVCSGWEEEVLAELDVYPNPAFDRFMIALPAGAARLHGYRLEVTNQLGQQVVALPVEQDVTVVTADLLSGAGVYLIRLVDADGRAKQVRRVVVM